MLHFTGFSYDQTVYRLSLPSTALELGRIRLTQAQLCNALPYSTRTDLQVVGTIVRRQMTSGLKLYHKKFQNSSQNFFNLCFFSCNQFHDRRFTFCLSLLLYFLSIRTVITIALITLLLSLAAAPKCTLCNYHDSKLTSGHQRVEL